MGCDVHMWAEIRPGKDSSSHWVQVGPWLPNPSYHPDEPTVFLDGIEPPLLWNSPLTAEIYTGRNYRLFGMLAGVRNGVGVAGADMGDPVVPIAEPRGVPKDASGGFLTEVRGWGGDGHSHSWLTLEELRAYDWTQTVTERGWVDHKAFQDWQATGRPGSWSGGVSGAGVQHVSNAEMAEAIATERDDLSRLFTRLEWHQSYREAAGHFMTETLPGLVRLSVMRTVGQVRIVFFFDN